jgi:DNA-binding winged helix-turn-helix (wHTH) protein/tetratricopeptide (TPR) repeat protein
MTSTGSAAYEFGDFRLEADKRLLFRRGEVVRLRPRVFDTLLHLVRHQGKVVSKEELMRAVWPDTAVEENNLNQNISILRRVFGENRWENRYISTVSGRGYQFIPEVRVQSQRAEFPADPLTIGVLPFENLSGDPDREYMADGLTEEVIATLGQINPSHLGVIGRTTMMAYKGVKRSLAAIGGELGVAYLVESAIRSEQGRIRITSNLIRIPGQVQVWSMSYDSQPTSMLEFQREISTAIGRQVRLQLPPERLEAIARRQSADPEAHDLYLRGRYFWNQLSSATTRRASEFFARATEVDPQYALAWSGLADAYTASPINADVSPLAVAPLARKAAEHAIRSGADLAESQTSLGFVKFWLDWEWRTAEAAFRRAIKLDSNYPLAHRLLGVVLAHMRRHSEAMESVQRARELDPLLAGHHALSSQIAFMGRDYGAAVQFAKRSMTIDPEFWIGYMQLGQAYEQLGDSGSALEVLNTAGRLSGGNSKAISLRGYILAKMGRTEDAMEVLRLLQNEARERYVPPYAVALVHVGLSQHDEAFRALTSAFDAHDVHLAFLPADAKWDPLRDDARFQLLLRNCRFDRA